MDEIRKIMELTVTLCSCGRPINNRCNSTIKNKRCPNCELKFHVGNKNPDTKAKVLTYKKTKRSPKSLAMAKADKYFSQYIRLNHCKVIEGGDPICKCIISGRYKNIKEIDNGHYISRSCKATRYHEDNCRPQNRSSNRHSGEADHEKFGNNLLKEIGQKRFDNLFKIHNDYTPDTEDHYEFIARYYRNKIKEIIRQLGIDNPF